MENAVLIIIIIFVIMFLIGLAMSFLAFWFNKHKTHPVLTIIFSILLFPLIYIPLIFTIGLISRLTIIIILPYCIIMIIWAVKNNKMN